MVYHFVKRIGIDIEAESLEKAAEVIEDMESDFIDDEIGDFLGVVAYDTDHADNIDSFSTDCNYTEYVGGAEEDDPEKRLYDYISGNDDEEDEDTYYVLTDKGKDFIDTLNGKRTHFDPNDYDEDGKRIESKANPCSDALIKAFLTQYFQC